MLKKFFRRTVKCLVITERILGPSVGILYIGTFVSQDRGSEASSRPWNEETRRRRFDILMEDNSSINK